MKMNRFVKCASALLCISLLAASLAACSKPAGSDPSASSESISSSTSASSDAATSDTAIGMANPWVSCASLSDAADITGYEFTVPDSIDGFTDVSINVLKSEQLTEVQYTNEYQSKLCLRKAPGDADISGDYHQYAASTSVDVNGRSVIMHSDNDIVYLATWTSGGYTYSIGIYREDGGGLTLDEMTALVDATA